MGLNLCWIGVEAAHKRDLLDWLGLEPAGDVGDELGAEFTLTETPEGWVVVASATGLDLDEALAGVSAGSHFAIGGEIKDILSFSRASASRDSKHLWSVSYNERDQGGLVTTGDLPLEFASIEAHSAAEKVAEAQCVRSVSETPADLAEKITGYRPGSAGLEWTALRKKRKKDASSAARPPSLRAAMLSALLPLLRSLGWESPDRPVLADMGQIVRTLNGIEQTIWFDYGAAQETYVIVHFFARAPADQPEFVAGGRVTATSIKLPIWKRFTWKRLNALTRYEPPPVDLVSAVVDRAREDILVADGYLRNWGPDPRILLDYVRPIADWPSPPDG